MNKFPIQKLHTFLGHNDSLYTLERVDETRFLSAGGDGMVVLWDLENPDEGEVIAKVPGSIYAICYDARTGFLYVGQNDEGIHKIDFQSKKEVSSISLGSHQIFDIKVYNEGIWVGLQSGEIVMLSESLEVVGKKKLASERIRNMERFGESLAVACSDNITRIMNYETGEVLNELKGHKNSVFAAKYHPTGKYLASVGRDAHIKIWDTNEEYVLRESIAGHLYSINDLVFRKDGRFFVTASMDKSIKLWDAYNFKLLKVLDKHRHAGHGNSVNKLLWMDFEDLLVSCSDDRSISIWKIDFEE